MVFGSRPSIMCLLTGLVKVSCRAAPTELLNHTEYPIMLYECMGFSQLRWILLESNGFATKLIGWPGTKNDKR